MEQVDILLGSGQKRRSTASNRNWIACARAVVTEPEPIGQHQPSKSKLQLCRLFWRHSYCLEFFVLKGIALSMSNGEEMFKRTVWASRHFQSHCIAVIWSVEDDTESPTGLCTTTNNA
eukprot:2005242-Amphidinium_carterae.2